MKKLLILVISFLLVSPLFSIGVKGGFLYGSRSVSDSYISDVYGSSSFYNFYLGISPIKGLTLGLGKESNYNKNGEVGTYNDSSTLKITSSIYFFGRYEHAFGRFSPYLKIGFFKNEAEQTFENDVLKDFEFKIDKTVVFFGAGIKFNVVKHINIVADIYTLSFDVKPFEETKDLGGLRFSLGAEFCYNF